ncbi:MAG: peptidoglycan editing factor PgeF [Gammaproteobacteria bacterium]|nr:peptidoglycan editing factor PgeF [Gammaproteobacteria bacterium]
MSEKTDKIGWIPAKCPVPDNVHAGTTTRMGGMSDPPYDTFNLAEHVGDNPKSISHNRELLRKQLNLPAEPRWLKQIHGNRVITAQTENLTVPADGIITDQANTVCVVLTADCLPLLLCDAQGTKVAAVHVGWRGFSKNIIANTIEMFSAKRKHIMAWMGPCISTSHYEVGAEVRDACLNVCAIAGQAFTPGRDDYWYADLHELVRCQLEYLGIENIYGGDYCTYSDSKLFFSHRRDGITGRMASLIWMDSS